MLVVHHLCTTGGNHLEPHSRPSKFVKLLNFRLIPISALPNLTGREEAWSGGKQERTNGARVERVAKAKGLGPMGRGRMLQGQEGNAYECASACICIGLCAHIGIYTCA